MLTEDASLAARARPTADSTIPDVFERVVDARPEAIALQIGDRQLTYDAVEAEANRVANRLRREGLGRGDVVGVVAERGPGTVIAALGAMKTGAAYVPLDPESPWSRTSGQLADARARTLVAPAGFGRQRPDADTSKLVVLELNADGSLLGDEDPSRVACSARPADLFAVIFTSGSTGRPKGAGLEHRNLLNLIVQAADLGPQHDEATLQVCAPQFDLAAYEIWAPLLAGARIVSHPPGRPEPDAVARTVAENGVGWTILPTSIFHQLVEAGPGPLVSLRLVLTGGEVLQPRYARRFRDACPDTRLVNIYGPTETTMFMTAHEVGHVADDAPLPVGKELAGAVIDIRDPEGRPSARGEIGELYIGGPGVSRGYLHRPELTAERYIGSGPDRRYRTGDLARCREDGELELFGRLDHQVKIRGYRVEPGEVEAQVLAVARVRDAAVVAREDAPGRRRLVAFVVPDDANTSIESAVRAALAERLPAYMQPSAYVVLDVLPRTPNGKIDRGALADAPSEHAAPPAPEVAPSTLALSIARIFADLLGVDSVDPWTSFLELGGDSLFAVQVAVRLRAELGIELPIVAVFDAPSPVTLAERAQRRDKTAATLPPIEPRTDSTPAPATDGQAKAFVIGELADESLPYQSQAVHRILGALDVRALERALAGIVRRHELLRTTFARVGAQWQQRVHAPFDVTLVVTDLRQTPDPELALAELVGREVWTPLDLDRPPLARWSLARLADDDHALVVVEHHVVHDGVSTAVFLDELAAGYEAELEGRPTTPTPPPVQWSDFARWQTALADTPFGRQTLDHWRERLADLPQPLELPFDRARPARQTYRGETLRRRVSDELSHRVAATASDLRATPFMVMFAAYATVLARYGNADRLVIGSGLANRRLLESERLIGMVVNTVPLLVDLSAAPTVAELVSQARAVLLDAQEHQDVPFERVVEHVAPAHSGNAAPLYQTLFSFHDSSVRTLRLPGATLVPRDALPNGSAKADVSVVVINRRPADDRKLDPRAHALAEDGLTIVWEYNSDLFDRPSAERMLDAYVRLLEELVSGENDRPVAALPMSDADDSRSGISTAYERDSSIARVFEQRVTEAPTAIAYSHAGRTVTYRALEQRANRLARRLRTFGVEPGSRVGVCLDRSPMLIEALLAILKAGAAYVPLDPHDPSSRLERQIDTARVSLVLTTVARRDHVPVAPRRLVCLDELQLGNEADTPPEASTGPLDEAYVMFTSGSTGDAKGVAVPHRAVLRLVRGADYVSLGPEETLLAFAPASFDASTFEIWGALLNGGRLAIAPDGQLSLAELDELVARERVTTLWLTAGLFHRVVDDRPQLLGSLRQLLAGGDVLSPDHVRRALDALPVGATLANGYGPTEATTFTTVHRMRRGDEVIAPVPIGRPIANSQVYILDDSLQPAAVGVAGDLLIGGDGVALGYVGEPELTAELFLSDPFADEAGARMYRSGDRVRWRSDGTIEFLGRADRQLKLRGFRIEPGEVEEALRRHEGVRDACVVAHGHEAGEKHLVAYVVEAPGTSVTDEELRRHAATLLPPYEVPSAWSRLPALPLTANGKVDITALPAVTVSDRRALGSSVAPADELERELVSVWRRVLGVDAISPNDDFFDLGGHSLLAVELFAAIEQTFGRSLPLATIFDAPTVRDLADVMRAEGWSPDGTPVVSLNANGTRTPVFLVPAGDGNAVGFGALARRLGEDQPVNIFTPRGLDGRAPVHASVERMAAFYIRRMRHVQPTGPYILGGRCLGAVVAYEMARRLVAEGHEVALVFAIDSLAPIAHPRLLADGTPFDWLMNLAWRRSAGEIGVDDPFTREGTERLLAWLSGPGFVADDETVVNRYLAELYRENGAVREGFPDLAHDAATYVAWAASRWQAMALTTRLVPGARRPPEVERLQTRFRGGVRRLRSSAKWRGVEALDLLVRNRRAGSWARRRSRIQEAGSKAYLAYRGGAYPGRVVVIRSDEYLTALEAWYALETRGITERRVAGTHRSILREPDVAGLAACLHDLIEETNVRDAEVGVDAVTAPTDTA